MNTNYTARNFVGVYFGELAVQGAGPGLPESSYRFPVTLEEALVSRHVTLCAGSAMYASTYTLDDVRSLDALAGRMFAILSVVLTPVDVVYSPNVNSVLSVLLNVGGMLNFLNAPSWRMTVVDMNDALYYPAVLSLDQRRAFSVRNAAALLGRTDILELTHTHPSWHQQQGIFLMNLTELIHFRRPPVCHRA